MDRESTDEARPKEYENDPAYTPELAGKLQEIRSALDDGSIPLNEGLHLFLEIADAAFELSRKQQIEGDLAAQSKLLRGALVNLYQVLIRIRAERLKL